MVCLGCYYSDNLCVDIKSILLFAISMSRMRGLLMWCVWDVIILII